MFQSKRFIKRVVPLLSVFFISTLVLVSCGAPASNKYLTMVAQFNDLNLYPNPNKEQEQQANEKINVHYSLLSKNKTGTTSKWSYKSSSGSSSVTPQGLTTQVDSSFLTLYGNLVNTIAYNLTLPASIFATTVANYNKNLAQNDRINLFYDENNQPIPFDSDFYKSMANNLLVANNETNVGFGISDLKFNFKELTSTGTIDSTKGIYDVRKNNTLFKNDTNEITTDATAMSNNSVNNRLSKIFAVTDISIYFRFYIAGVDRGNEVPPRTDIVISNPTSALDIHNKQIVDNAFQSTFGKAPTAYSYKVSMNDMVATVLYSSNDVKAIDPIPTQGSKVTYNLAPSLVQSLTPLSWLTSDQFLLTSGTQQNNLLKMNSSLLPILVDQSQILTKEQFQLANESSATPEEVRKTFIGHNNWVNAQSAAFITEIANTNLSLINLKNKILSVPSTSFVLSNQNNPLNFTVEDYFKSYFKSLVVDTSTPFNEDISK